MLNLFKLFQFPSKIPRNFLWSSIPFQYLLPFLVWWSEVLRCCAMDQLTSHRPRPAVAVRDGLTPGSSPATLAVNDRLPAPPLLPSRHPISGGLESL